MPDKLRTGGQAVERTTTYMLFPSLIYLTCCLAHYCTARAHTRMAHIKRDKAFEVHTRPTSWTFSTDEPQEREGASRWRREYHTNRPTARVDKQQTSTNKPRTRECSHGQARKPETGKQERLREERLRQGGRETETKPPVLPTVRSMT